MKDLNELISNLGGFKTFYTDGSPIKKARAPEISLFEKKIGFLIPSDYKQFLVQSNGGNFSANPPVVFSSNIVKKLRIGSLFNFQLNDKFSLLPSSWENGKIIYPDFAFPIGCIVENTQVNDEQYSPPDEEYDLVFISLSPKTHGNIFVVHMDYDGNCDMSEEAFFGLPTVTVIAENFTQFIGKLATDTEKKKRQ